MNGPFDRLFPHAGLVVPLLLGAAALWLLAPRMPARRGYRLAGIAAGIAAAVAAGLSWLTPSGPAAEAALFYLFAAVATTAAVLTVTNPNPVYGALWFAVATLAVCGLFLLRSAPFLAAATVIVYAGAIVVTFLFVIMLARQHGTAVYDRRAVRPLPAALASFALLGGVLFALGDGRAAAATTPSGAEPATAGPRLTVPAAFAANPLSRPDPPAAAAEGEGNRAAAPGGGMRGLGRALFGDYLFSVELAGTVLLVAAIGAVAVAPRRTGGGL